MGNRIKEIRIQKNISLKKCQRDTGISIRTLKRYERGKITTGMEYMLLLADYYDVSLDVMFDRNEINFKKLENSEGECI